MATIESGSDHVEYDLTGFLADLLLNPENGEPLTFKTINFVGKDKTLSKQFDGIEYGPYILPGDRTVEVEEFKGQGILWSYIHIYFK